MLPAKDRGVEAPAEDRSRAELDQPITRHQVGLPVAPIGVGDHELKGHAERRKGSGVEGEKVSGT